MPPKPTNWAMYGKMAGAFALCAFGGPALIYYVSPTEEELFLKYNPELQKRSLENRKQKQEDFDHFVGNLKKYSKTNRPIWEEAALDEKRSKDGKIAEQQKVIDEIRKRKDEMRKGGVEPIPGGSL